MRETRLASDRRSQLHQDRPNESRGFFGTGLRDANNIENVRDRRDLDRSPLGAKGPII